MMLLNTLACCTILKDNLRRDLLLHTVTMVVVLLQCEMHNFLKDANNCSDFRPPQLAQLKKGCGFSFITINIKFLH